MPPDDSVRSWALIRYQSLLTFLLGYQAMAMQLHVGFQSYLKVDDDVNANR